MKFKLVGVTQLRTRDGKIHYEGDLVECSEEDFKRFKGQSWFKPVKEELVKAEVEETPAPAQLEEKPAAKPTEKKPSK